MAEINGWKEISDRTYMNEKQLINLTEISPTEYVVVLVVGLSSSVLKHFKTKPAAEKFMLDYIKSHPG